MKKFIYLTLILGMFALPYLVSAEEAAHGSEAGGGGLLDSLGIDPPTIIIQALGFLIVLIILWKFAFGKVGGMLDARRDDIQTRMRKLEDDQKRLDQLSSETQQRLNQIQSEAQTKIQQAVEDANREREQILNQAREEAVQERERALQRIQQERDAAILELRATVADLAIGAANKILNSELDEKRHRQLIDDFITTMPSQPVAQD